MPLYDYRCGSCLALTEVRHAASEEPDDRRCACGGRLRRSWSAPGFAQAQDARHMEPLERQMHFQNKAYWEGRAQEIRSGQVELNWRGPKEFWPQV